METAIGYAFATAGAASILGTSWVFVRVLEGYLLDRQTRILFHGEVERCGR